MTSPESPSDKQVNIVVCQRGFVYVGYTSREEDKLVIRHAMCVRRWGTERGLGQIALEGPSNDTVLDATGVVRTHVLSYVCLIECDESKWRDVLATVPNAVGQYVEPGQPRVQIVVCQRGFIYAGRTWREEDQLIIADCTCVRRWGTERGLGEIAMGSPTPRTTLDVTGKVKVHVLGVVLEIDCDQAKWQSTLANTVRAMEEAKRKPAPPVRDYNGAEEA